MYPVLYEPATVLSNTELGPGHHVIVLKVAQPLPDVRAGQFINLRCDPADKHSLMRPLSILDADHEAGTLSVYYKALGRLSARLGDVPAGAKLDCLYPLGTGFPWTTDLRRVALVGGGVGLAPLLYWSRQLEPYGSTMYVEGFFGGGGAQDLVPQLLADYDFPMRFATMDGSLGYRGTVVELFCDSAAHFDAIYSCGPNAMLAALQAVAPPGIPAFASLEEYMACGVGACLGCVARIADGAEVRHQTVCKEGPVFDLRRVQFAP
jgi:dihydroorotate dehydrogenase electron transfer subunit